MPVEAIAPQLAPYAEAFEHTAHDQRKRAAFERFLELGFPSSHDEDWKFTNLNPLARAKFDLATRAYSGEVLPVIKVGLPEASRLIFINGYFAEAISTPDSRIGVLSDGRLRIADPNKPFNALNAAFFSDGARVNIPAGAVAAPIYLIHYSAPGERPCFSSARNSIVVEKGAQAAIVEVYLGAGQYFTNAVTEIIAGDGAIVDHYKFQRESEQAFHISTIQIAQGRDSVVTSRSFAFGGALARTEINATLDQGSECTLNGLYLVNGRRHVDTRTTIDHAKPHATSHELYKGIMDGHSSAVFNGKILVRKDAQKTDAKQTNKNLVLSEDATINTKPQLEIFADDVKCTHGATVGQLDAESIFYLRSRGIGFEDARRMLIEAFAREIIDGVKIAELRESLGRFL